MDTNIEYNLNILGSSKVHQYPTISYTGAFSSSKNYITGDVLFYNGVLYQTIIDGGPFTDPLNPNFISYNSDNNIPAIYILTSTNLVLVPGSYYVTMQGGGAGGEPTGLVIGGGGGGAGSVTFFNIYIPQSSGSQNFQAIIGAPGGQSSNGGTTSLLYVPMDPISQTTTAFMAIGGIPGTGGNGGVGYYGGGAGAPNGTGGNSFIGNGITITPGQSAIPDSGTGGLGGSGSFAGYSTQTPFLGSLSGGGGGGIGGGRGAYYINPSVPSLSQNGVPNSGGGGGGGSRGQFNTSPASIGGSGWLLIKPLYTAP